MTLIELAEVTGLKVRVYYSDHLGKWYASLEGAEVKDGRFLTSEAGYGNSPSAALQAYARIIAGKRLVIGAYRPDRKEFSVPKTLIHCEHSGKPCAECGGVGSTTTETRARYGDPGEVCPRCDGTGRGHA